VSTRRGAVGVEDWPPASPHAVLGRILCGVDGGEPGLEAVRQATRLLAPGGTIVLGSVCESHLAVHGGLHAADALRELEDAARTAIERGLEVAPDAETRIVRGETPATMLALAESEGATLVAVGTQGFGRAPGILLGSLPTRLLHDAPCSVLVARPPDDPASFPRAIAAGVDGSPESLVAAAVARELGARLGASLRLVVAEGGKGVDADAIGAAGHEPARTAARPVDALLDAGGFADLLVVGSRGLHGLRALGSVSERVAHRAPCSVLVVRGAA
jgi:nucleotide-binding universal stress UspA family protein